MLSHRILAILSFVFIHRARAGNTTCLNNSMDWFTQSVGETPCRVYERLRGLCSPGFQVGNMGYIPPGDKCGDQVGACCCNTVAFALSMLCMSCQYGIGSGENGDYGFDAPRGTYSQFLNDCGRPTNQSLPITVQKAVCNAKIKIPSYVYTPSWQTTGEWYFYYTRQTAQLQINSGDNETSTRCNEVFATGTATTVISGSSHPIGSSMSGGVHVQKGGIVGIVFGGVALLFLGAVAGFFLSKRFAWWGRNRGMVDLVEGHDKYGVVYEPYRCTASATQLITTAPILHNAQGDSEWTYTGSSSSSLVQPTDSAPAPITVIPRPQKGRVSPGGAPNSDSHDSSRSPLEHTRSNGFQIAGPGLLRSELPPSYEPRHS